MRNKETAQIKDFIMELPALLVHHPSNNLQNLHLVITYKNYGEEVNLSFWLCLLLFKIHQNWQIRPP